MIPLLLLFLAQAPAADAGAAKTAPWMATVGDDVPQGDRVLNALLTPLPAPNVARLELKLPDGAPRRFEYAASDVAVLGDLREAVEQNQVTLVVLTIDTLVPYALGKRAVDALVGSTARIELRFAGPTKIKGAPMPEVLKLAQEIPAAPPLTRQQVRDVIEAAYPEVRRCYQTQLEENALEGKLVLRMVVKPGGEVEDATILQSQLSAPEVHTCVTEVAKKLKFPRLKGSLPVFVVTWPFLFKKGADKPPLPPIRK
jgi:hypothetical protein